jgi:co-chaperonin GroES (HSP10)
MSKVYLQPAGDYILVVDMPEATTIDGIEMPDDMKQKEMTVGTVIYTGPLVSEYTNSADRVVYGPYAGKTVIIQGVQFRLLKEGQIEGYIRQSE